MKYIIYKITISDYTYIGSTKDFTQRKIAHKNLCKKKELKVYELIREAGGWDKCEMIPIEEYDCEGQLQARIREEYWRREYNANLNTRRAYITEEERNIQDKELTKKWKDNNRELCIEQASTKYICECGGKYTHSHKTSHNTTSKHLAYLENQNLTIL